MRGKLKRLLFRAMSRFLFGNGQAYNDPLSSMAADWMRREAGYPMGPGYEYPGPTWGLESPWK